tara:strand:+ start:69 stop:350 length:282 start_codon:yes stop_codon:yes gene_type:complete
VLEKARQAEIKEEFNDKERVFKMCEAVLNARPSMARPRPPERRIGRGWREFGAAWGCSLARRESQRLTEALGSWGLLSGALRESPERASWPTS